MLNAFDLIFEHPQNKLDALGKYNFPLRDFAFMHSTWLRAKQYAQYSS